MLLALYIRIWTAAESLTPVMGQLQVSVSVLRHAQLYPLNWTWTTFCGIGASKTGALHCGSADIDQHQDLRVKLGRLAGVKKFHQGSSARSANQQDAR